MSKIKLQIKNRWTGSIIFEYEKENNTIADTVNEAIKNKANLSESNLSGSNLSRADLSGADLSGSNLSGANLSGSNLSESNLSIVKNDFWEILLKAKKEIDGLKEALISGKVDGSTYSGECCCLVGTIANVKHCSYRNIKGIKPNSDRPAERWFLAIRKGDTPNTSKVVELTMAWIEEFELYLNA